MMGWNLYLGIDVEQGLQSAVNLTQATKTVAEKCNWEVLKENRQ